VQFLAARWWSCVRSPHETPCGVGVEVCPDVGPGAAPEEQNERAKRTKSSVSPLTSVEYRAGEADMTEDLAVTKTILILESDELACRFIHFMLQREGFRVLRTAVHRREQPVMPAEMPDLVVLDLTSREAAGAALCRELRSWYSDPILALSSRSEEHFVIEILDAGADTYVNIPFKAGELMARVRALLRSNSDKPRSQDVIRSGEIEIDLTQRRLVVAGNTVRLTRTEFNILACLARSHDRPVSTEFILETVWGPMRGDFTQSLRVHIGHIRRKIEPDPERPRYLFTHRGGRYRLTGTVNKSKAQGR
jgi:two-component system, OmpR family, KDP operon response regulator KdpE